ncbi:cell division protein FtsL [Jeotgalibaca porci]|uniref:Cell division protein FtsL n=1 Tax=Jeotgalibaca porci TaxID=1868793 RepID=A0A6G7WFQ0_9LACT|nr:cell division protein FtsL [Jeotgalibaca porci]NLB99519.1 cell division protein FtsL [Lactobacillales bacterium]QIK51073.1 cell division protein FtsL [Jeotgalibaca porci]
MATPEYANNLYDPLIDVQNPSPQATPVSPVVPGRRIATRPWAKEIVTLAVIGFTALILVFTSLITQVTISNQNRQLQDLQNNNVTVSIENNNLNQEVQELSRYNRIMEIAESMGLKMNETNVRNVTR